MEVAVQTMKEEHEENAAVTAVPLIRLLCNMWFSYYTFGTYFSLPTESKFSV
jgi:hypothetical protein